jgi:hypothetical protein
MRLLLDRDVYEVMERVLISMVYDVVRVFDIGKVSASNEAIDQN